MKPNILTLLATCLIFSSFAFANSSESDLFEANSLYRNGEFEKSALLYEKALVERGSNFALHYNLANAWAKSGQLGKAILHYRRALILNPRNADIRANLSKARNKLGRSLQGSSNLVSKFRQTFNDTELQLAFLFFYIILLTTFLFNPKQRQKRLLYGISGLGTITIGVSLFLFSANAYGDYQLNIPFVGNIGSPAVVLSDSVAHSGDSTSFAPVFKLKEGDEITSISERNDWVQVRAANNRVGWLPKDKVQDI